MSETYNYTFNPDTNKYEYNVTAHFPSFSVSSNVYINGDFINRSSVRRLAEERLALEFLNKFLSNYLDWSDVSESDARYAIDSFLRLLPKNGKELLITMKGIYKD